MYPYQEEEMLQRVGITLGADPVDETRQFTVNLLGEAKAQIDKLSIQCKQLDGTFLTFDIVAGQIPQCVPGIGNLVFPTKCVQVRNTGTASGRLYIKVTDDLGTQLWYWEVGSWTTMLPGDISQQPATAVAVEMPMRNYAITIEVGHL